MTNEFVYDIPTRLLFGPGALDKLGDEKLPGKKALLVMTGGKSAKATGAYDRLLAQLAKAGASVVEFPKVQANPLRPTVMEGAALAKAEGCDFIVALGGGSVMDAAKMIGVMARNPGDLWDYAYTTTGGNKPYPNDPLPLVCVTTTRGNESARSAAILSTSLSARTAARSVGRVSRSGATSSNAERNASTD